MKFRYISNDKIQATNTVMKYLKNNHWRTREESMLEGNMSDEKKYIKK